METLLDEMRDGVRAVTAQNSNILLQSVDCLREMLEATQAGSDVDEARVSEYQQMLERELALKDGETVTDPVSETENSAPTTGPGWIISFAPESQLFQAGNDPLGIIRELAELGELEVDADFSQIPVFNIIESKDCYLSWAFKLFGDVSCEQINEVFSWVVDIADLKIEAIEQSVIAAPETSPVVETKADNKPDSNMPVPQRRTDDFGGKGNDRRATERRGPPSATSSIRVDSVKIDALINMVGELVITQSMLGLLGETIEENQQISPQEIEKLCDGLMQLERNTRELQENVMPVRMMPISFTFSRFPRLVRDLSTQLGKKIELEMSGEGTEVDKNIIEKIGDPLVHLVRNSLDHGIEMPEDRLAVGKPEIGVIQLNASHRGGNIVIEISDDGKGLNKDVLYEKGIEKGLLNWMKF